MNPELECAYSYIFWPNFHDGLWYMIDRSTQLQFFNGHREDSIYYSSKSIETLLMIAANPAIIDTTVFRFTSRYS